MPRLSQFVRPDAAHPHVPAAHRYGVWQCGQQGGPSDDDERDEEDDFVPPELDDPRRWEDFGADFDNEEEPDPERGDFYTDDDEEP